MKEKVESKLQLKVKIFGSEYPVKRKGQDDSYYEKIASYVDQKMCAIEDKASLISVDRIAILSAMQICEELFKAKDENGETAKLVKKRLKEMTEILNSVVGTVKR